MSGVLELFSEKIAGVYDARNVSNVYDFSVMCFAHAVFMKVEMFGAFACAVGSPINHSFVIVVNGDCVSCVRDAEVDDAVFDVYELDNASISGDDFSLAQ